MSDLADYLAANQERYLDELSALLRIPSVSARSEHDRDTRACAEFVAERMRGAGIRDVRVHPTDGHPIVTGSWLDAGPDAPTILVYGHYDVQPPEPLELWRSPPFEPVIADGKIVARGAADDKGQFYCHIKAAEAHLATRGALPINVKFLIEGEEEVGSKHLASFLEARRELLAADAVVISDTSMLGPEQPSITYGLRGLTYLEVEVTGPGHDLHSGLYGGGVENPIFALAQMLATLKDDQGRIAVDGFYDAVVGLTDDERARLAEIPFDEAEWLAGSGAPAATGEVGYSTIERLGARPCLDICGIWGGYMGEGSKTVLPSKAFAKVSARLVPDQTPRETADLIEAHLRRVAPATVTVDVRYHHGGMPARTSIESPIVQAASRALHTAFGAEPVFTLGGGSIPIVSDFKRILGLESVLMGFGLDDDRIHSPNEKLDVAQYLRGIAASAYLLDELATS